MVATDQKDAGTDATPMTLLKQELRQYLGAQMKHLAQKAGNKLTDATGLSSVDEDSGPCRRSAPGYSTANLR